MEYTTDFEKLKASFKLRDKNAPASANLSENAAVLLDYLKSVYGSGVIAGQQYLQREETEDKVYLGVTGKLPAIRGYDLMDMDKTKGDDQLSRAVKWAKKGAIITFCWHWYAPDDMDKQNDCMWSFYYKTTDYNYKTSFNLLKAVEKGTKEYNFVISRIDKAAEMLGVLDKEGIPVLWRPLHEANGNWFWWGNNGEGYPEAYKKLWYMIYDRMENYHKLKNLIWVWNGQSREMLVDRATFDVCGDDIYSSLPLDHSAQTERYSLMEELSDGRLITLSECGFIPAPDELKKCGTKWLWWLPWWGEFVYKGKSGESSPEINEKYMDENFLKETFADDYVITMDKLPRFPWAENE